MFPLFRDAYVVYVKETVVIRNRPVIVGLSNKYEEILQEVIKW